MKPLAHKLNFALLPLAGVLCVLLVWMISSRTWSKNLPSPGKTWEVSKPYVVEPLAKRGELDQGILRFAWYSLVLVAKGYAIALLVGTPLGFFLGLSPLFTRAFDPIIQILRPVSPLAWLPLGLVLFENSKPAALFTIALCAMWPTVLNTAMGVRAIPQDYLNVARVLNLSGRKRLFQILIPATLPYMFTGFRLSLGIAWLVIVAVEMLTGAPGIGGFLWQEYNSLIYEHIILCILTIGVIGFALDLLMGVVERRFGWLDVPFLELRGVSKGFGANETRADVLRDITLTIERGEFVAIVGYSGAGKTTLISLIAGLLKPDAGTITLDGRPVTGPGPDRGVVFQNYSLLPWLTVYENVYLAVDQVFREWPKERKREHTERYVAMVNLAAARDKRPGQLSGGMRQRVSVARALAMDPQVLLLDEPLSALDALTRATLQDEIERIWERDQKTVVLITNDVDEGILLADRIVPLSAGPGATLGPAVAVELPRPRNRKALNHDDRFKRLRGEVIEYLLGAGGRQKPRPTVPLSSLPPLPVTA